jgi:2-amino-4-hydroxy-6-hydroxymethyldihydropteridine diphosphokinase
MGKSTQRRCWIALGSNLDLPEVHLQQALLALDKSIGVTMEACSSLIRTPPLGPPQPTYVNAVARVRTDHSPALMLELCRGIESSHGRRRTIFHGPRTLDLDLLFYESLVIDTPVLQIPHPRLHERRFVVDPLCEIDPLWIHPTLHQTMTQIQDTLGAGERGGGTVLG